MDLVPFNHAANYSDKKLEMTTHMKTESHNKLTIHLLAYFILHMICFAVLDSPPFEPSSNQRTLAV